MRETYYDKKHFIKSAHIHYVSFLLTKGCKVEIGENPKGLPLGRR